MVASVFAVEIDLTAWGVDLALIGTQKARSAVLLFSFALNSPSVQVLGMGPDLGIVCVSDRAWPIIHAVNYEGYDALAPFHKVRVCPFVLRRSSLTHVCLFCCTKALAKRYFPYTPNWRAVAVLHSRLQWYASDGNLQRSYENHARAADLCRRALTELGEPLSCLLCFWFVFCF
jgi:aspartate aminotransferase-like enzyme